MRSGLKLSLGGTWLLLSLVSLILPVYLPTAANPQNIVQNAIGMATFTMYVLAFPIGLFGIPLLYISQIVLSVDPNSIGGKYLNLFLVFLLGVIQWFWIVPKLYRKQAKFEVFELPGQPEMQLNEPLSAAGFDFFDAGSGTPLERVFQEKDRD